MLLKNKVVMVTGGGMGMGRAHAVLSARHGADVIIVDIAAVDSPEVSKTVELVAAEGRQAIAVRGDVTSQESMDHAVKVGIERFGAIDVLIANAGIFTVGSFWEATEEDWDRVININLTGSWKSAKAVAPHMIERGTGSIVMISSVNGIEAEVGYAPYVAAKHGILGLMKNVAKELAPHGVRCNAICPGVVDTPMANAQSSYDVYAGHEGGTKDDMIASGYRYSALKGVSVLDPEDIANTAVYLNSDLASKVTGVTVPVDAGHLLLSGVNTTPVSANNSLVG